MRCAPRPPPPVGAVVMVKNLTLTPIFLALTLLIGAAGSASAEMVLLTCEGMGAPSFVVTLDMAKRAVLNAHGLGKRWYPVQMTDDEIRWDENPDLWFRYTLNRITG